MSKTQAPQAANQLLVSPYSTTVLPSFTPAWDSSFSNCSLPTMSRRTLSLRSLCQEKLTAPGTWERSYRPGLTLTSTMRTSARLRLAASHSVLTSGPSGTGALAWAAPPTRATPHSRVHAPWRSAEGREEKAVSVAIAVLCSQLH